MKGNENKFTLQVWISKIDIKKSEHFKIYFFIGLFAFKELNVMSMKLKTSVFYSLESIDTKDGFEMGKMATEMTAGVR